jgi:hypothetical protein
MGDFANFGGTDEENAEIKRLNGDIVRCDALLEGISDRMPLR